jgi:hypothetical protein
MGRDATRSQPAAKKLLGTPVAARRVKVPTKQGNRMSLHEVRGLERVFTALHLLAWRSSAVNTQTGCWLHAMIRKHSTPVAARRIKVPTTKHSKVYRLRAMTRNSSARP